MVLSEGKMIKYGQNNRQKRRNYIKNSRDTHAIPSIKSKNRECDTDFIRLSIGSTILPQPEPGYTISQAVVQLQNGGNMMFNVPWPGGNVECNIAGLPFGPAIGVHGLFDGPMPGQKVVVGFIEGNSQKPVILNKYPYMHGWRTDNLFTHVLPLTTKLHSSFDVVLGHFTGSYIKITALPIPAAIEISAQTAVNIISKVATTITSAGLVAITAATSISLTSAGPVGITGSAVSLTSAAPMLLSAPSVQINAGIFPAAAVGDLVATMLGPQPVLPGPGRVPTLLIT